MIESRLKKSILNARVNLIFYFITLVLSFFSRDVFLSSLGADFVGLTGTLQNLLGFLNLAEMGIGAAIGVVLYRPLFTDDKKTINEIVSVLGFLYRRVGTIICVAGVLLSLFLPKIFAKTEFDFGVIYIVYISFLASSLISYYINYRQTLLGADQRNYVVTAYYQSANICKLIVQMILAYTTGNYYLWAVIELTFGIIYSVILNIKINQVYPWLKSDIKLGKVVLKQYPNVIKYTKQLFVHKIGEVIHGQISPLLIYAFASLQTVAYYGNYTLITYKLNSLLGNVLNSTYAGVGSLIAEGDKKKILKTYWELMAIRFWIAGIFVFALYYLLPPFITLWIGEKYLLSDAVLVMLLVSYFLGIVRGTNDQFVLGFGLFADIWAPLVEAAILVVVAIIGGKLWGFEGVLTGSIFSTTIIIYIWKPYYLFKKGFCIPILRYWFPWIKHLLLFVFAFYTSTKIVSNIKYLQLLPTSWKHWILGAIVLVLIHTIINTAFFYLGTKGMRDFVKRIKQFINNLIHS